MSEETEDRVTWWLKNKNKVWTGVLILVGALGGNSDRLSSIAKDVWQSVPADVVEKIDNMDDRLIKLEKKVWNSTPTPTELRDDKISISK